MVEEIFSSACIIHLLFQASSSLLSLPRIPGLFSSTGLRRALLIYLQNSSNSFRHETYHNSVWRKYCFLLSLYVSKEKHKIKPTVCDFSELLKIMFKIVYKKSLKNAGVT